MRSHEVSAPSGRRNFTSSAKCDVIRSRSVALLFLHPREEDAMKRWIIAAALLTTTVAGAFVSATAGASADELQVVRLDCAVRGGDDVDAHPAVHCRWSEPHVPPANAIRLWRLVDPGSGAPRQVVYRSDDLAVQEFTDSHVRRGHVYLYAVQLLDENGRTVGRSRVEAVRIPAIDQVSRWSSSSASSPPATSTCTVAGDRQRPAGRRRSTCGARSTDTLASSWHRFPPTARRHTVIRCLPARAVSRTP